MSAALAISLTDIESLLQHLAKDKILFSVVVGDDVTAQRFKNGVSHFFRENLAFKYIINVEPHENVVSPKLQGVSVYFI